MPDTNPANLFNIGTSSASTAGSYSFNTHQIFLLALFIALLLGIAAIGYILYRRLFKYNVEVQIHTPQGGLNPKTQGGLSSIVPVIISYDYGYTRKSESGIDEFYLVNAKRVIPALEKSAFYPQKKLFHKTLLKLKVDEQGDYHPIALSRLPGDEVLEQPNYQKARSWHTHTTKYLNSEFRDKPTLWQLYGGVILSFIPFAIIFIMVLMLMNKMDGWIAIGAESNKLIAQALLTIKGG